MRTLAVAFMSLVTIIFTAVAVDAGLVSSTVKLVRFDYDEQLAQIDAQAIACPPAFWGKWVSRKKLQGKIKQTLRTRLVAFQRSHKGVHIRPVSFKALVVSSFIGRSPHEGCTTASAVYRVDFPASAVAAVAPVTRSLPGAGDTLKVGLRTGYPMISQLDDGTWSGAAPLFASMIGAKVGKDVQFVQLHSANQRLSAVEHGMVDLVISLLSYTDDRATQVDLSEPYFTTGLVIGTTNIEAFQSVARASELNKPAYTILVATGTTAEDYARAHFPRAKIDTVPTTPQINVLLQKMRQEKPGAQVLCITDEVIAAAWDIVTLQLDGKTLLTDNDRYVVAVKKGNTDLINAVNDVIRANKISEMYADLTGQ
ncbi:MAG: transporter substrate-binding domain-containing protein [Candidatus Tectomicrobia bacterium]